MMIEITTCVVEAGKTNPYVSHASSSVTIFAQAKNPGLVIRFQFLSEVHALVFCSLRHFLIPPNLSKGLSDAYS